MKYPQLNINVCNLTDKQGEIVNAIIKRYITE